MNISLVNPKVENIYTSQEFVAQHLGLAYLGSYLRREGHRVDIFDGQVHSYTIQETVGLIKEKDYDIVGFSIYSWDPMMPQGNPAFQIIKKLRSEGVKSHIVVGGYASTFWHEEFLINYPEIDSVCRGEGEETLSALAAHLHDKESWDEIKGLSCRVNGSVIINDPRPLIQDLDSLPIPADDDIEAVIANNSFIPILTSRGCYGRCSFCCISSFYGTSHGKKWRTRRPRHIIEEIAEKVRRWNYRKFRFIADEFVGPGKVGIEKVYDIANELKKRKLNIRFGIDCRVNSVEKDLFETLKDVGLSTVFLGVESGVQRVLDTLHKNTSVNQNMKAISILEDLDIETVIGFMMFDAYTTLEEVKENYSFIKKIWKNCNLIHLPSRVIAFKGTPLERELREKGQMAPFPSTDYLIKEPKVEFLQRLFQQSYYRQFEHIDRRSQRIKKELRYNNGDSIDKSVRKEIEGKIENIQKMHIKVFGDFIDAIDSDDLSALIGKTEESANEVKRIFRQVEDTYAPYSLVE